MNGTLHVLKLNNVTREQDENGKWSRAKRTKYVHVYLPPVNPPATGDNDIESENEGRITNKYVRIGADEVKFKQSTYTGEQLEQFERYARDAMNNAEAMAKAQRMMENNKVVAQKFELHYCFQLRIVKDYTGEWVWSSNYDVADITTEKENSVVFMHEKITDEFRGRTGEQYNRYGEIVAGTINRVSSRKDEAIQRKDDRVIWREKIGILTSTHAAIQATSGKDYFMYKRRGGRKWLSSIMQLDDDFELDVYYEDETLPHKEIESAVYQAAVEDEKFKDKLLFMGALALIAPPQKKVLMICDHNPRIEGRKKNYGCGHSPQKCHVKFFKNFIVNMCANAKGKNRFHDEAKEIAETLEVKPM